jgi:sugar phosphate isomerase/epimerase
MKKSHALSRRAFVRDVVASAAVVGCAPWLCSNQAAVDSAPWTTAIRDTHLKLTGESNCWSALERVGAEAIEMVVNNQLICTGLYHPDKSYRVASADDCKALHDELARHHIKITALCMSNRLDEALVREVDWTSRVADAAERLGVSAIRIDVVPHTLPADQFLPFAIKACRQLCATVRGRPIRFGVENHGRFTNDPDLLGKLFDGVNSDQLGLTLDVMNFYWFGHPLDEVYNLCAKFASRACHTHCKNLNYPSDKRNVRRPVGWEYEKYAAPLDEGDIDYKKVTAILRQAGYRGDLCLENECLGRFPKDQHVAILRRELAALRALA